MSWLYLLLVALAGTALALQAPINAQLARWLEHPVRSSMVSFTAGALSLFVLTLFWGRWPGLNKLQEAPPWVWAGGLLGAFYITVIILATPRIGATATFALVIAGQLSASILMDHFGVLGLPKHPADWMRLLGGFWSWGRCSSGASQKEMPQQPRARLSGTRPRR